MELHYHDQKRLKFLWSKFAIYNYFTKTVENFCFHIFQFSFFQNIFIVILYLAVAFQRKSYQILLNEKKIYNGLKTQCNQWRPQSIFGDTVHSCYCKLRLVICEAHPSWGLRGRKFLILITLDRWKRHFREKNYIENFSTY